MGRIKCMLICLFVAGALVFMAQPVMADSACAIPEVEYCLFSTLDPKAKGTNVFMTLTAYYIPADLSSNGCPDLCLVGEICVAASACTDPQAYLIVLLRVEDKKGGNQHFIMRVTTESLQVFNENEPCDAFLEAAKCKCRRAFAIENDLESVPLCTVTDQAFQDELFLKFIGNDVIPVLFPATPDAPFAIKSVSNYVINDDVEPFYGILDLVLAVQE